MTLSQEQLNAACDQAKKEGLRTLVHAYKDAVRTATMAGCTEIEHGTLATDDDLKLMAEKAHIWTRRRASHRELSAAQRQYLGTPDIRRKGLRRWRKFCR